MIEVGEFVRTKSQITKIIGYDDDNNFLLDIQQIITKTEAKNLKYSKNIIDLIEVGDIVNGYRVLEIKNSIYENSKRILIYRSEKENYERWIYIQEYNGKMHTQDDIKTILTHEQYKQNAYEVEE